MPPRDYDKYLSDLNGLINEMERIETEFTKLLAALDKEETSEFAPHKAALLRMREDHRRHRQRLLGVKASTLRLRDRGPSRS
jgi:hypothetical protein